MNLINSLKQHLINLRGWRTDRKIIVFESDDWGSIRMAGKKAYKSLLSKGYRVDQNPFNSNDRLESDTDVKRLAQALGDVKDKQGNPAKFTLNIVMANPDFEKIEQDAFTNYYFENFKDTLSKNDDSQNVLSLYKKGISEKVFQPQLHGREHINLRLWLNRLRKKDVATLDAFQYNMFTVTRGVSTGGRQENLDAFGCSSISGKEFDYRQIIKDAQELFEQCWGYKSVSFIAPCYVWHPSIEKLLFEEGVEYIQGTHVQRIPINDEDFGIKKRYHYIGEKNKWQQLYLVRNCTFEPTTLGRKNAIYNAMKGIDCAFTNKKPAIICTHRVNYIGTLNEQNRELNLKLLGELLTNILYKWPEAEFMSSDQLGAIIKYKKECVE